MAPMATAAASSAVAATARSAHKTKRSKRGSRNKKKTAKRIDLSDVAEHLEDVRLQERTGGLVADKSDEQLFTVQVTAGDGDGDSAGGVVADAPRPLSRKERARAKVLYNDQALAPNPHIKPVTSRAGSGRRARPGHAAVAETHVPAMRYRPPSKRRRVRGGAAVASADESAPPDMDGSMTVGLPVPSRDTGDARLWERAPLPPTTVDEDPWLAPEKQRAEIVKPPRQGRRRRQPEPEASALPAVEVPVAGTSYNPSFGTHQTLLGRAADREAQRVAERARIDAELPRQLNATARDEALFRELSAGLGTALAHGGRADDDSGAGSGDSENDSGDNSSGSSADKADRAGFVKCVVRAEDRKTRAQVNKQRRHLEREARARQDKARRAREAEVYRLRGIRRELLERDRELEERQAVRQQKSAQRLVEPRRLGPKAFREPELAYKLTDELSGSLRASKPESDVVKDRFVSLQKRNRIEVRVPVTRRRRYKLKEYTKRSYKNYELQEDLRRKDKDKGRGKRGTIA